ncbi:MAG: hypothetical protein IJH77_05235, partial [Mogibacterium sp.]|nr:hypothetical protein [Mogibacterium sp.]
MSLEQKALTIIVLCYSRTQEELEKTLSSLEGHSDIEVFLFDHKNKDAGDAVDPRPDDEGNVFRAYGDTIPECMERALDRMRGRFFTIINAGDGYYKGSLKLAAALMENEETDVICGSIVSDQ